MLQIVQSQKTGIISAEELPAPECLPGGILVRTAFSLISAGTEKTSVENAKSSLLQRVKRQPEQARQVLEFIRKEGVLATYRRVRGVLDSYKALGYSASGVVIESGVREFSPGDLVACAGAGYANHAEIITVPKLLAAKVPAGVPAEQAAFATVGSIAMQGVRQAQIELGSSVAVIGLGLIGQITIQLLKAAGARILGLDVNPALLDRALELGCDAALPSSKASIASALAFSRGLGFDSVIITAGTSSNEPVELSMHLARKRGTVVVVGAVSMNIPREPFYKKEINFTISCSYGPGRYDPNYEERGLDYPPAYARWTENRNMLSFLDLIAQGKIDMSKIVSHVFEAGKAADAYDLIMKGAESYSGILLKYPQGEGGKPARTIRQGDAPRPSELNIGFIGLGSFAQNNLIHPLKQAGAKFVAVANSTSVTSKSAAAKYGFAYISTSGSEVISRPDCPAIFIASRHDSHGAFVAEALRAGKSVFVEKPAAVSREQLDEIRAAGSAQKLMVGFNRRFSESVRAAKKFFAGRIDPMALIYRVNAGAIPLSHWTQDPAQGGRIVGEACHFVDTLCFMTDSLPRSVFASSISSLNSESAEEDVVSITIKFEDGSVGTINYFANGDPGLGKEYMEAHCERRSAVMDNFVSLRTYHSGKETHKKFDGRKGHAEEIAETVKSIKNGLPMPIAPAVIFAVHEACFAAVESLRTAKPVSIQL